MNHQEIATAFDTVYKRSRAVAKAEREWIDAERDRLQAECKAIGHIFGRPPLFGGESRQCVVCGTWAETEVHSQGAVLTTKE